MKTIAVSIDESTLQALDRLTSAPRGRAAFPRRGPHAATGLSRSEVVRTALHEFLARRERAEREELDRTALARHRDRLARQAEALVSEQAKP